MSQFSLGGKSTQSIRIQASRLIQEEDMDIKLESIQSDEDNKQLVYET